jgi:DNA repair protein RadC
MDFFSSNFQDTLAEPSLLNDAELLAQLFAGNEPILEARLIQTLGNLGEVFKAPPEALRPQGLGDTEIRLIQTVREIALRLIHPRLRQTGVKILTGEDAYGLFGDLAWESQEVIAMAFLTTRNRVLGKRVIFKGTVSGAAASPREILREALRANAAKMIVAHNHPSGSPGPSEEDLHFTKQLKEAGEIVGIPLVDHLIICERGSYFSFKAAKQLGPPPLDPAKKPFGRSPRRRGRYG